MTESRLDLLTEIVKQNPENLLARYGLAMEYSQQDDSEKALENFRLLMELNPDYVAAYYQSGRVLQKLGEVERAREMFTTGISASERVGDLHARSELEAALAELQEGSG
jgi:Tfp pilus assembly protein PilF